MHKTNKKKLPSDAGLLTARETAFFMRISLRKLWEITNRREIASVRIGRSLRYAPADISAYIETKRCEAAS